MRAAARSNRAMPGLPRLTALAVIAAAVALPLTAWLVVDGMRSAAGAGRDAAAALGTGIAALFTPAEVTTFTSRLREAVARSGDELLVATAQRTVAATATSTDFLGGTRVAVSAAYTAQYTVRINRWAMNYAGGTLFIRQSAIQVLQPVAVDVASLRWESESALLHFGRGGRLKEGILQQLQQEAWADAVRAREEVRAQANQAVTAFVRSWLLPRDAVRDRFPVERVVLVDTLPECPSPPLVISL